MTWEEAVKQFRDNPNNRQAMLDNYFEPDIYASAGRFLTSDEFTETLNLLPEHKGTLLDIGAGRGIASYAFAKSGYQVTALEPDTSNDVGSGAIRAISAQAGITINVVESYGEKLPFADNFFNVVYARQVLHHAYNLEEFCAEVARVLKHGGVLLAAREHVLSKESDLDLFLESHPLHKLYGGENAFTLQRYIKAMEKAGLKVTTVLHPYASVINYYPLSTDELKAMFVSVLGRITGSSIARTLMNVSSVFNLICNYKARRMNQPGRLYSFIAQKG